MAESTPDSIQTKSPTTFSPDEIAFAQKVARIIAPLSADPLSWSSRERQKYLMISSIGTIALSLSAIDAGRFSGLTINNHAVLTMGFALATAYLIFPFRICAREDLQRWKLRLLYADMEFEKFNAEGVARVEAARGTSKFREIDEKAAERINSMTDNVTGLMKRGKRRQLVEIEFPTVLAIFALVVAALSPSMPFIKNFVFRLLQC